MRNRIALLLTWVPSGPPLWSTAASTVYLEVGDVELVDELSGAGLPEGHASQSHGEVDRLNQQLRTLGTKRHECEHRRAELQHRAIIEAAFTWAHDADFAWGGGQWKSCESIAAASGKPSSFDIRSALIDVVPSRFCRMPSTSRNDDSTTVRRSAA